MNKILITGATGFIGKELISKLRFSKYDIIKVNSSNGNISDKATWLQFEPADVLIHLASHTYVPDSWKEPYKYIKTNFYGTICALEYCRQHNVRMIYLSSYLYGNSKLLPTPESAELISNNPYGLSKKFSEEACKFYADFYGIKTTILRPFNVYGPEQPEKFLIPTIISQARNGKVIVVKDLKPKRDYVYLEDLVDAIIKVIDTPLDFDIFNIGSGVSYSVEELINIIQNIIGTDLKVEITSETRNSEIMDTQADIIKAWNILGWKPKYSLEVGLNKIISSAI